MTNSQTKTLLLGAKNLFEKNRRSSQKEGRTYTYHVPSPKTYPFQWFWDSCFHAISLTHLGKEGINLAKEEIRALLAWQRPNGFIPHVIYWDPRYFHKEPWHWHRLESKPLWAVPDTTELIQPPVIAQAVERIWQRGEDRNFLEEIVPKVYQYYRYLSENRDPDKDALISLIMTFESGLDFSPQYDPALGIKTRFPLEIVLKARGVSFLNKYIFGFDLARIFRFSPFDVEDLLVNCIYAQGLDSLSNLLNEVGAREEARWAKIQYEKVKTSLYHKSFDPKRKIFWSLGKKEEHLSVLTISSLMPLVLPDLPSHLAEEIVSLIKSPDFLTPYPLPSVATSEKTFSPDSRIWGIPLLWRGSSWINTNWFIYQGLKIHGYDDLALELSQKSRELILKSGFREYFHPYTGEGLGAENFGWSTLVVDMER